MALNARSEQRLEGVHPDLQAVVRRASQLLAFPLAVIEGVRTEARQAELYAQGRTKPGKVVTWTMDSRHRIQSSGYGCAVDLVRLGEGGRIDWNNVGDFMAIGKAMLTAGAELGIPVRWGYDWDGDGITRERGEYDGPHFELPKARYP